MKWFRNFYKEAAQEAIIDLISSGYLIDMIIVYLNNNDTVRLKVKRFINDLKD